MKWRYAIPDFTSMVEFVAVLDFLIKESLVHESVCLLATRAFATQPESSVAFSLSPSSPQDAIEEGFSVLNVLEESV